MWEKGRQGTGYLKKKIFQSESLMIDCWLVKYPPGSYIPKHVDINPDGMHHRINIILKRAKVGGIFKIFDKPIMKRFIYFRPDYDVHEVTEVKKGTRWVLSIGWINSHRRDDYAI